MRCELRLNARQFTRIEAKVATQFGRAIGAVQIEERFLPVAAYMHVRRAMVARVDDDAQPVDPEHSRHRSSIPYSQPLGLFCVGMVRWCECLIYNGAASSVSVKG